MKVEFVNPFVSAAFMVLEKVGKTKVGKGTLSLATSPIAGMDVNTVIGVTGDILGQVIFSMSTDTAQKLASVMLMGLPIGDFDEIAKSAISELGNIITGNAATELGNNGFCCNITPPSLFMGKEVQVSIKDLQILLIPVSTDLGDINIYVALREADK
ncbi:MAG: chemotaxis protein CheX [Firmicutes bacterium]|nr:chemotaxis protein CheX [Bacillota bacterium]